MRRINVYVLFISEWLTGLSGCFDMVNEEWKCMCGTEFRAVISVRVTVDVISELSGKLTHTHEQMRWRRPLNVSNKWQLEKLTSWNRMRSCERCAFYMNIIRCHYEHKTINSSSYRTTINQAVSLLSDSCIERLAGGNSQEGNPRRRSK